MAKFLTTFSSSSGDGDGKKEAQKDQVAAAKQITDAGHGKDMYAKVEKRAGDWQVNIYER